MAHSTISFPMPWLRRLSATRTPSICERQAPRREIPGRKLSWNVATTWPCAWPITEDQKAPPHPAIAVDRVAFSGEIVAVVVARTAAAARDAAELVDVDYAELPAALDLRRPAADET